MGVLNLTIIRSLYRKIHSELESHLWLFYLNKYGNSEKNHRTIRELLKEMDSYIFRDIKTSEIVKDFIKQVNDNQKAIKESKMPEPITNPKIKWLGTQKEFAELIIELEKKGWIEHGQDKSISSTAIQLASNFDLSSTKKKEYSNLENSLYQILKPQQSKEFDYIKMYPQIYTTRYKKRFETIKENKISKEI